MKFLFLAMLRTIGSPISGTILATYIILSVLVGTFGSLIYGYLLGTFCSRITARLTD